MSAIARLAGQVHDLGVGPERSTVHLLPCAIRHDGAAKVDAYFRPAASGPAGGLEAAFRGRRLTGHVLDLAARGLVGALLVPSPAAADAPLLPPVAGSATAAASRPLVGGKRPPPFRAGRLTGGGGGGGGGGGRRFGRARTSSDDEEDEEVLEDDCGSGSGAAAAAAPPPDDDAAAAAATVVMRTWELERAFDRVTYWLYDTAPSEWDTLPIALDWFEMAAELHGPVSEAELGEFAPAAGVAAAAAAF